MIFPRQITSNKKENIKIMGKRNFKKYGYPELQHYNVPLQQQQKYHRTYEQIGKYGLFNGTK